MNKIFNSKKNKVIAIVIVIVIIAILSIIIGKGLERKRKRQFIFDDSYWWTETTKYDKTGKWINKEYAVDGVSRVFKYMKIFKDKNDIDYDFYREYLTENEINSILSRCYKKLKEDYNMEKEEVDTLLEMFIENKEDGYNTLDNYTKYLGERAYFFQEKESCNISISTTIHDDHIMVKEKYKTVGINSVEYALVLKDKDFKILDVIEEENTIYYENEKSNEEYKIDIKNVSEVEVYITYCHD